MIYVGIDIGKTRHCAAAIDEQGQVVLQPLVVVQDRAGLEALDQRLHTLGSATQLKIGVEASGHYWKLLWQFLLDRGWQVDVLNPVLSAATARRHLRGRKTDADDAIFIAKTLRDGGFSPLVVGAPEIEQIKTLCRQRSWTISLFANAKRRLITMLDRAFPEFASHFADPCGRAALAVLLETPNAKRIAALHLTRLTHLLCEHSRNRLGSERATKLRNAARATPFRKRAQGKGVEPSVCKTELPGASPGRASTSGPSSNSKTTQWHCVDRGAIPRGSTTSSGMRKTAIRAVRIGEILGAAPRCPTNSIPPKRW